MAKLISMFLVLIAIQIALLMYGAPTPENTPIWEFVTNFNNWSALTFITAAIGLAGGVFLVGAAISGLAGFKTDFLILAPVIGGLLSIGVVFANLARVIGNDLTNTFFTTCDIDHITATSCNAPTIILAVLVGVPAFIYAWTVLEWWRGKDY